MDLVLTAFAHDRNTLYRNVDGRQFEDASATAGLAAATFVRMGWGTAFLDADLDGRLDLFFANGHIFADIDDYPQLGETYRQKNQLLLNVGARFRDVSARAGGGLQVARVGRGLAVGDLDDDGDPDLVVSNMDDAPTLLENRQRTGHHWVALPRRVAGREPIRHRREGDDRRRGQEAAARDSLGRQLSVAERSARATSAWATAPARWPWRCGCRAARAGDGRDSPATGCTCSSSRIRRPSEGWWRAMNRRSARAATIAPPCCLVAAFALRQGPDASPRNRAEPQDIYRPKLARTRRYCSRS